MIKKPSIKLMPLWAQISSVLAIICICIVIATGEYIRHIEEHFLIESLEKNHQNIFNTIASTAIESIILEDIPGLDTIVSELVAQNPDIYSFSITNEDHKKLTTRLNSKSLSNEHIFALSEPIKYENEIFGYIDISWDVKQKHENIEEHIQFVYYFITTMLILLTGIIAIGIHLLVTRPLRNIENRLLGHATGKSFNHDNQMLSHEFIQLYKTIDKLETLTTSKENLQKEVFQRKNAQTELAKARDVAINASRAKSTFLAKMSHELRTPLNAIIGYSELIAEDAIDNGHDAYNLDAIKITNAGQHLLDLINNILDLSKIEAGKMELSLGKIEIASFIQTISDTITPLVSKNENILEINVSEDIEYIQNDEMKLKQIIINILSNACKFTHQGIITLKVQQLSIKNTNWLSISINDTGVGISQNNLEHIFDSFSQADNSTSSKYGGTGLGLSISKNFAQMMGGDLNVESTPDKGSTFSIQIPVTVQKIQRITSVDVVKKDLPLLKADALRFNNNIKYISNVENKREHISHVFIIEPDAEQQEQMKLILLTEGLNVDVESDFNLSFTKIKKDPPSIIVINTVETDEKSLSILNQIKSNNKLKNIPVIVIVKDSLSEHFLTAGASSQIPSRYTTNDLLEKIKISLRS